MKLYLSVISKLLTMKKEQKKLSLKKIRIVTLNKQQPPRAQNGIQGKERCYLSVTPRSCPLSWDLC